MKSCSDREMTFLEHLEELRWVLIKIAASILLFAIPSILYWREIFDLLMVFPLRFTAPTPVFIYTNPAQGIVLSVKIALASAVICAAPFIFYQVWKFLSPALKTGEKRLLLPVAVASTLLFLAGVAFCYFTLPFVLQFLIAYASGILEPMFRADEYLGFMLKIALSLGFVFQLPVISFILARSGIITHSFLIRNSNYAVITMFIVAALLTPPDIFSQIMIVLPLSLLYGLSIVIALIAGRKST
ncbi:Twin-arginine translocation protein TatC [Chitinispirillum alkaliphilum]|nr:Twin-arginine translocation protein TatC [Chitinispirillum alkaliphilum]